MTAVARIHAVPADIDELAALADGEGHRFVRRLIDEFASGRNTFRAPGEALFEARVTGRLVGLGGLNVDPYASDDEVGRVRHLYVHPDHRGRGIGRALIGAIEAHATRSFRRLRLFTEHEAAGRFYRALGYDAVDAGREASHVKRLGNDDASPNDGRRMIAR